VISRNKKVKEMIAALKENEKLYTDVIKFIEDKFFFVRFVKKIV